MPHDMNAIAVSGQYLGSEIRRTVVDDDDLALDAVVLFA
jgi:hypothetical protein